MSQEGDGGRDRRWFVPVLLLGAFLSLRGYRSLEGDQAYRFPILWSSLDPNLYPSDPFVASFRVFNPHRGALAVAAGLGQFLGLSLALVALFVATFLLTVEGARRLATGAWPEGGRRVGVVASVLFLITLAGNIGTNHLFEPIVLDRQLALGLLWFGLAGLVADPDRGLWRFSTLAGMAAIIHPTFAFQSSVLVGAGVLAWKVVGQAGGSSWRLTLGRLALLGLALAPGLWLNLSGSELVTEGLPLERFRLLSLELQGPQHMLPHLWRWPQWLAWGCFPVLAALATIGAGRPSPARSRIAIVIALSLAWLGASWIGVEVVEHLRFTLFQPFRMATVCRGLCLLLIAGHVERLWRRGGTVERTRAVLLGVGLTGDWSLVVVTLAEATWRIGEVVPSRRIGDWVRLAGGPTVLGLGLVYLSRHDTESGHVPLLAAIALTPLLGNRPGITSRFLDESGCHVVRSSEPVGFGRGRRHGFGGPNPVAPSPRFTNREVSLGLFLSRFVGRTRTWTWTPGRRFRVATLCWAIPLAAVVANAWPEQSFPAGREVREWLVKRCRFGEVPIDDVERLALWCREHTPTEAHFIGPPGPKTFRLWSRRSLAFNRAGSPYVARGLGDWAERFADHVGFQGDPEAMVRAYQADRHGLERGYDRLSPEELARLARRQGADYVVSRSRSTEDVAALRAAGLILIHQEGRYSVYQTSPSRIAASTDRGNQR
ncbi:MAG: DUF6798 domain-containing protein [Isosphaeraceae bacterium]